MSSSQIYRFICAYHSPIENPLSKGLLQDAHALGFNEINSIDIKELYFIKGALSDSHKKSIADYLLNDSFVKSGQWELLDEIKSQNNQQIEISLKPGVTDVIGEQLYKSAQLLGVSNIEASSSGYHFIVHSSPILSHERLELLAKRLLANTVIHDYAIGTLQPHFISHEISDADQKVILETIPLRHLSKDALNALSKDRRAALNENEMLAIQTYYEKENRDATDVEFEMIAQTWSEHCSHKTFKADIHAENENIPGLLNTYIRKATQKIAAPWVYSAFVDNAGIIDFDDEYHISFKVETHNHPSAIEPFGGSNTGLGGVIRDVLGVSATPIASTDVFCLGPENLEWSQLPQGALHPRLIRSGVIAGVQDYGNKTGIPTVNGAIWTDPAYTANPLVFCGCVGIAPKNSHPRSPQKNDRIILIGGRTGRDGLRGATFSSMTMDAQTGAVSGASVQIGDPIIARGLIEVVTRARDESLYHAITDCGAGGLSSAVGEMASSIGAEVDITPVKLKYAGLLPWEIWLSEAQERMVLAVPPNNVEKLQKLCDIYDIELTDIGYFTDSQVLNVLYRNHSILSLSNHFLHEGMPKKTLVAKSEKHLDTHPQSIHVKQNLTEILLALLSHPNIASKENVIRLYDHEVQGASIIKPLVGIHLDGPSDACVLKPFKTKSTTGIVLSNGLNPEIGKKNPYNMAVSVIDEAIRNAVAVGADPSRIAILDNFCWGNPERPETLSALVDTCKGCYDAAIHYQTPFISGKDSLNNEYMDTDNQRHAIPSTLLISAIGLIPDVSKAVSMDFKKSGNVIYLLGKTLPELKGSHLSLIGQCPSDLNSHCPTLPELGPQLYRAIFNAMQSKLIQSCHDLSEGGFLVALAEMCIAGKLGCDIALTSQFENPLIELFSESNGRFLVEVSPQNINKFESCFENDLKNYVNKIGSVTTSLQLSLSNNKTPLVNISIESLVQAFTSSLKQD